MLQVGSSMKAADNSGAKFLKIIGIPGNSKRRFAKLGDVVTVVVDGASSRGVVKDHTIYKAVIVRTRKEKRRKDGSYIRFDDNACVLLNQSDEIRGTRIFGPVARELRDKQFMKIISLAPEVL